MAPARSAAEAKQKLGTAVARRDPRSLMLANLVGYRCVGKHPAASYHWQFPGPRPDAASDARRKLCFTTERRHQPRVATYLSTITRKLEHMADSMNEILHPGLNAGASKEFPHAPQDWSTDTATQVAQQEDLSLDTDHWEVIRALQEYFARNAHPNVREIHDALDERFHSQGGLKYLYRLLPGGPVAQGCRLAGIEAPAGAEDKSFGSVQ